MEDLALTGNLPFDGYEIHSITPLIQTKVKKIIHNYKVGKITEQNIKDQMQTMLIKKQIEISLIDSEIKQNPLSGKGKSYGEHVESGWGKHVPIIDSVDYFSDLFLGKWESS